MTPWNRRLHQALDFAARAHHGQSRKDPDLKTPYVAHVYAVAYLLAQHDFPEEVVIAGLLHDVLEDHPQLEPEVASFGETVLGLVRQVSETKRDRRGEKLPWQQRKAAYLEQLRAAPAEARALSCADKIHNLQSLLLALDRGADIWSKLGAGPAAQVARFQALGAVLAEGWDHPLLAQYAALLKELGERLESGSN